MFKTMFESASIDTTDRKITNHSGKVMCCTEFFNSGFSDKAVCSRSGHPNTAVHEYQHELQEMKGQISHTLNPPVKKI